MNLLTWSRVAEGALAVAATFVAVRSPRHRPFAAWVWLSLAYSILAYHWIEPVLSHLPRPYTGRARLFLHVSQALYVAVGVGFVSVVFALTRERRWLRPLPWFVGFVALVALVGGYGHSPGPGLYRAFGLTFRSRHVYELLRLAGLALILATLVPRARTVYAECRSTDDLALFWSVISIATAWAVSLTVDLLPVAVWSNAAPLSLLLAYALCLGLHAPLVVWHSLGPRSHHFVARQALAQQRESIFEMARRLEAARAATDEMARTGRAMPTSFPNARPLAHQAGLTFELIALALEDRVVAGAVECVLAVAASLGTVAGAGLLVRVDDSMRQVAADRGGSGDDEFPWLEAFQASNTGTDTYLAAVTMPLIAQLKGLSWNEAFRTIEFAKKIATAAAMRDPKFRARANISPRVNTW